MRAGSRETGLVTTKATWAVRRGQRIDSTIHVCVSSHEILLSVTSTHPYPAHAVSVLILPPYSTRLVATKTISRQCTTHKDINQFQARRTAYENKTKIRYTLRAFSLHSDAIVFLSAAYGKGAEVEHFILVREPLSTRYFPKTPPLFGIVGNLSSPYGKIER